MAGPPAIVALALLLAQPVRAEPAADPMAALSTLGTVPRTLAARLSTLGLDVRDFGAKCDGATDDTAALQAALDVATGHAPAGAAHWLAYQARLIGWQAGIGPSPNGGGTVRLGSGACLIAAPLVVALQPGSAFALVGDGTSNSQIVQTRAGDGIDIREAANPQGQDIAHAGAVQGQAFTLKGFQIQTAWGGDNEGAALRIDGRPATYANAPPEQIVEDVDYTVRGGWAGGNRQHQGWRYGLLARDVSILTVSRSRAIDYAGRMRFGFAFQSDAPSPISQRYAPPGGIVCSDCASYGGHGFLDVSGFGIQAVFLERPQWVTIDTGVTWLAPLNGSSGSIVIHAASGASGAEDVHLRNIGTVFSSDSFYYTNHPGRARDWHGFWAEGDFWVVEHGDIITAPGAGTLHPATAYGDVLLGATAADGPNVEGLPSLVASSSVAGGDFGFSAEGRNVMVQGVVCAATATCLRDTYAGRDPRFHPTFLDVMGGEGLIWADAGRSSIVGHAGIGQVFTGGLELGQPGVPDPTGTGSFGFIDFHSAAPDVAHPGLNDYDCRAAASGGMPGATGQGGLRLACRGGLASTGPIIDQSASRNPAPLVNGFRVDGAGSGQLLACPPGTTLGGGVLVLPPAPDKLVFHIQATCRITTLVLLGSPDAAGVRARVMAPPPGIAPASPEAFVYDAPDAAWVPWR